MGESIFIEPTKRWLRGMQNRIRDQQHFWSWRNFLPGRSPTKTADDDPIAYIRGIFEVSNTPVETTLAPRDAPDGGMNQLAPDLVESVFVSKSSPPQDEVTSEREETDESLPIARKITSVSLVAPSEDETAEAAQEQEQAARPISSDEPDDSTHEAVEEMDNDVEPSEDLSDPVEETLTPKAHDTNDDVLDSLVGDLKDIFVSKVNANPQTTRLIQKHGAVDAHELVNDLRNLVRIIGDAEPRH